MTILSWHKRIVPATVVLIALLFTEKAIGLVRDATARDAAQPVAAMAVSAIPVQTALPARSAGLPAMTPVVAPGELQLLQDLRRRRQLLDERERTLDQRADLLRSTQLKLEAKLDELTSLQRQLERLEDERHDRIGQNWTGLVKTYEDMKPKDAAAIFDVLDMRVLLEVLDRMEDRKAAAVLADMLPERARIATQMLAQKRTRQDGDLPSVAASEQHG